MSLNRWSTLASFHRTSYVFTVTVVLYVLIGFLFSKT